MARLIVLLSFLLIPLASFAAEYEVVVNEQTIEGDDARKARKEAIDKAISDVTLDKISQMIGDERFQESQKLIKTQVLPQKNKFIPFFKITKSARAEEGFQFEIEVKLSTRDLRQVLRRKGLFSRGQTTGIVFPFLEFNDHVNGESFRWWLPQLDTKMGLARIAGEFEQQVGLGFLQKGLLVLQPQKFKMIHGLPEFLQKSFLTQTEKVQIAALKKSQLMLAGKIDLVSSPLRENALRIRVQVRCLQASNGKSVAEIVRSVDTPAGQSRVDMQKTIATMARESGVDLAGQIFDLWQRGALEAQVLKLAVTGELNHQQLMTLKAELAKAISGVQSLREHMFEPGRVTFEVDYNGGGVDQLRRQLSEAELAGFMSQVVAANAEEVILDVKPHN